MLLLSMEIGKYYIWQWVVMGVFLLISSIQDIKYKALTPLICFIWLCVVFTLVLLLKTNPFLCGLGLIPGIIVLICAFFTRQAIGYGDGVVILIIGLALGMEKGFCITMMAFLIAAIVSLFMLVSKRVKQKTEIPFIPFLAVAFMLAGVV